jgi:RNA polymerase sigma-70 factor (ECF subfamily)
MQSAGNTDEFVRLFSLYAKSIYSYIHVLVPTHADAEDLFQETSRTLWQKFGQYRPGTDEGFRAWALRIAQIEVLSYRRRAKRHQTLFNDQLYQIVHDAASTAVGSVNLRLELLADCYRKLPDDDRQLIDTRYKSGERIEAIAARLGRSTDAVYRALRRIHQRLFHCIQRAEQQEHEILPRGEEEKP